MTVKKVIPFQATTAAVCTSYLQPPPTLRYVLGASILSDVSLGSFLLHRPSYHPIKILPLRTFHMQLMIVLPEIGRKECIWIANHLFSSLEKLPEFQTHQKCLNVIFHAKNNL